jgi:hypothetical protein
MKPMIVTFIDFLGNQGHAIYDIDSLVYLKRVDEYIEFLGNYRIFILGDRYRKSENIFATSVGWANDIYAKIEFINFPDPIFNAERGLSSCHLFTGEIINIHHNEKQEIQPDNAYIHCYWSDREKRKNTWFIVRKLSKDDENKLIETSQLLALWVIGK